METTNVEMGVIPYREMELLTKKVNNIVWVALKPLVTAMGLDWRRQSQKIQNDERYRHMSIPYETKGGMQDMLSLDAYQLPAFLYSINPNKVRKDLRERIISSILLIYIKIQIDTKPYKIGYYISFF